MIPDERGWLLVEDMIWGAAAKGSVRRRKIPINGYPDSFEVSIWTVLGHIVLPIEMRPSPDGLILETAGTVLLAATWSELKLREPAVRVPAESPCMITYRRPGR